MQRCGARGWATWTVAVGAAVAGVGAPAAGQEDAALARARAALAAATDEAGRLAALKALWALGPKAAPAAAEVLAATPPGRVGGPLNDGIVDALAAMGPAALPAVLAALEGAGGDAYFVALNATQALGALGPGAREALERQLAAPDVNVRRAALWGLGRAGAAGHARLARLAREDADPTLRRDAVRALGAAGREGVPLLVGLLGHEDAKEPRVPGWAAEALVAVGLPSIPACLAALPDVRRPAPVRAWSAWALGRLQAKGAAVRPALVKALDDPDGRVRGRAAAALFALGEPAARVLPTLGDGLEHDDPAVREACAEGMAELGPAAAPHASTLEALAAAEDQPSPVRQAATRALGACGGASVPALLALVEGRDQELAAVAADLLRGRLAGAPPAEAGAIALVLLERRLDEAAVLDALAAKGWAAAPSVLGALDASLEGEGRLAADRGHRRREVGLRALTRLLGPAQAQEPGLVEKLRERLGDASAEVQAAALDALLALGDAQAPAAFAAACQAGAGGALERFAAAVEARPAALLPAVFAALRAEDAKAADGAAQVLGALSQRDGGRAALTGRLRELVEACASPRATRALRPIVRRLATTADAPALLEALGAEVRDVRRVAAGALTALAPATPGLIEQVVARVEAPATREGALELLSDLATEHDELRPRLAAKVGALLARPEPAAAAELVDVLEACGEDGLPELVRALGHAAPAVRAEAAGGLALLGPAAAPALEALVRLLDDPDEKVVRGALTGLSGLGAAGAAAAPALEALQARLGADSPTGSLAGQVLRRVRPR